MCPRHLARIKRNGKRPAAVAGALALVAAFAVQLAAGAAAQAATTSTLYAGQTLTAGQALYSANGRYRAVMQGDGNFVVYGPTGATWATGTQGHPGSTISMQWDGNLVVYAPGAHPLYASGTEPSAHDTLVMQDDGNLVIYSGNRPLWVKGTRTGYPARLCSRARRSASTNASTPPTAATMMQGDGNFVVYGPGGATWWSGTDGNPGGTVQLQSGGDLVVYDRDHDWKYISGTGGAYNPGKQLVMQNDGNLVIYSDHNVAVWVNGRLVPPQTCYGTTVSAVDGGYSASMFCNGANEWFFTGNGTGCE